MNSVHQVVEACAKVCEREAGRWEDGESGPEPMGRLCAAAIRDFATTLPDSRILAEGEVAVPSELAKDLQFSLDFTSYSSEDDSVGYRSCCQELSYVPHSADCPIGKLADLLSAAKEATR